MGRKVGSEEGERQGFQMNHRRIIQKHFRNGVPRSFPTGCWLGKYIFKMKAKKAEPLFYKQKKEGKKREMERRNQINISKKNHRTVIKSRDLGEIPQHLLRIKCLQPAGFYFLIRAVVEKPPE